MSASKDKVGVAPAAESSTRGHAAGESSALTTDAVREFLKDNGDFLQRNPDLLDHLHVSHASGSAVSLVEKQVSVLRERNVDLRRKLKELTNTARENDRLYEQTRALVVRLLEADSLGELYEAFMDSMHKGFELEYASMILFGDKATASPYRTDTADNAKTQIGQLLNSRKAMCGALRKEEFDYLFGKNSKSHLFQQGGSAAIMPLADGDQIGLIAVGSSDPNRFSSDMGTLFLSHIAEVILRLHPRLSGAGS